MYVLPFQPHADPQQKVQSSVKENCHPCELPWGSTHCGRDTPVHFQPQFTAWFLILSIGTCQAQGCCCRRSLLTSSQILAMWTMAAISLPMSRLTSSSPPTSSCSACRQLELSHCQPQSGLLTWHLSASTAESLLLIRVITLQDYQTKNRGSQSAWTTRA
jgi:hypothetical protein